MNTLTPLHESIVTADEIDSLGHMNVRFYIARVASANEELLTRAGLFNSKGGAFRVRRTDTYTRFLKEQFADAKLVTLGGFVAGEPLLGGAAGIDGYFEIRNAQTQDVAATFLVRNLIIDAQAQHAIALPSDEQWKSSEWAIDVPAYGQPRSLNLAEPTKIGFETVAREVVDEPSLGMMSGRREGVVGADDCDSSGKLKNELDVMFLIARQAMQEAGNQPDKAFGPPVQRDALGRRYSWAMMETRSVVYQRPRLGDRVVSLGADIAWSDKWRHSRRWTYVLDSGELLGIADSLGICIDLDARKALSIPDELRQAIEQHAVPQLA